MIATALERAGHSVWWDKHIGGGAEYAREIEQALNAADIVVVLWTESSVQSPWVHDEAGSGRDPGRLVPLSLEGRSRPSASGNSIDRPRPVAATWEGAAAQ